MAQFDKNTAGYNMLRQQAEKEGQSTSMFDALLARHKMQQGQVGLRDQAFNPLTYRQDMMQVPQAPQAPGGRQPPQAPGSPNRNEALRKRPSY